MTCGVGPVKLPSKSLSSIPWGTITLSDICIQNLSTFSKYTDVKVIYHSSRKTIELQVPLKFDKLMITYDYRTEMFPITINGGVEGKLENVKINMILRFDFTDNKLHLDKFDIRETGKISIRSTGNGLWDWITNAMTSVMTSYLKPIFFNIVDWFLKDSLDSTVDVINKAISEFWDHTHVNKKAQTSEHQPSSKNIIEVVSRFLDEFMNHVL